ncbi:MAG: glycerophosphodiester phosphodiesterase family protein [Chloroflexota bacterium]
MIPKIFAHRGAKSAAPENTLPAFEKALEMGVDGVELDVQCSKDNQLMVIHDFTLDKTTSGSGLVSDFTASELAQLDAGSHFGVEFAGVGVPTLPQILDRLQGQCHVNIEIKSQDRSGGPEVESVLALIQERNLYDEVLISSFNPMTLIKTRWLDKQISIGLIYREPLPDYLSNAWLGPIIDPQALHPHSRLVETQLINFAHERNLAVNTWTVNDTEEARRLAGLGVQIIISDVPVQLMSGLAV